MPRIFFVVSAFAAGIVVAERLTPDVTLSVAGGLFALGGIVVAWLFHRRHGPVFVGDLMPSMAPGVVALVLIGSFGLGVSTMGLRTQALLRSATFVTDGRVVEVDGIAGSDSESSGRATQFLLKAERLDGHPVRERLRVRVFGEGVQVRVGDRITVEGKLEAVDRSDPFDLRLFRKRVVGQLTAGSDALRIDGSEAGPVIAGSNRLRAYMESVATDHPRQTPAGLVMGLTIGDERLISPSTQEDFRITSLSHLTAVSGANVAMVLAAVFLILRAFRVSKATQVAIGVASIVFFVAVTRWEPSVLRASVMAILALSAYWFGRASDPLQGMGVAALGLLAYDPFILWSIGFQLSFVAAAGILVLAKPIAERLSRLPKGIAQAAAVAISAQLAVTPLLVYYFGRISLVAVPANLVAFPLVAPITVLGLLGGVVGVFIPSLGSWLFALAVVPAGWLQKVSEIFGSLPWASVVFEGLDGWRLIASYGAIVGISAWLLRKARFARVAVAAVVFIVLVAGVAPASGSKPPADLVRFTFFDVGQGDAALVEGPSGARVLIDGGPIEADLAARLRRQGISRIDVMVMSHDHDDHYGGLADVREGIETTMAFGPPLGGTNFDRLGLEGLEAGERLGVGELVVDVLGPSRQLVDLVPPDGGELDAALNDASVILRVSWHRGCALFTGDLEEGGQTALVDGFPQMIRCTVLKAPHHGSARITEGFVATVDPDWVVVSTGPNSFGHPTRTALGLFERYAANVMRTDHLGDIRLEMDARGEVVAR